DRLLQGRQIGVAGERRRAQAGVDWSWWIGNHTSSSLQRLSPTARIDGKGPVDPAEGGDRQPIRSFRAAAAGSDDRPRSRDYSGLAATGSLRPWRPAGGAIEVSVQLCREVHHRPLLSTNTHAKPHADRG